MRIAFVGTAGAGKDYAASILVREFAFRRVAFADRLKVEACQILSEWESDEAAIAWVNGWKHTPEMRQFLQAYGVAMRTFVDLDYWIDYALTTVKGYEDSFGPQDWVLTDCRFENEAAALREAGFQIVRVMRLGATSLAGELASHVSETEQNAIQVDAHLTNPGAGYPEGHYKANILAMLDQFRANGVT